MTHQLKDGGQVLNVGMLARVEGEGGMHIEIKDREVVSVKLNIFEPPRFYEGFLRGRKYTEPPDITARICGICPVAYQSASTEAMETICGVTTTPEIQLMRRLLYCGEWIESHALHIFMLHAPDFLGFESVLEMAKDHADVVNMALRLKKCGNDLMEVVGGRAIHPVNVKVGGFYRMPTVTELQKLRPALEQGLEDALAAVQLVSTFDFPEMEQEYNYVSLRHPDWYPLERGTEIVATSGARFPVGEIAQHVEEFHVEHSNALHASFDGQVLCGAPRALQPQLRPAQPPLPRGRAEGWARSYVPQPLQVDHRAHRGTRVRLRGGAAHHRRLGRRPPRVGTGRTQGRRGRRRLRGTPRHHLAPLQDRRRRSDRGRANRAAHLPKPGEHRGGPAPGRSTVGGP
jgi:hypothetical protein